MTIRVKRVKRFHRTETGVQLRRSALAGRVSRLNNNFLIGSIVVAGTRERDNRRQSQSSEEETKQKQNEAAKEREKKNV